MNPPVDAPTSRQSLPAGSSGSQLERVGELLAAAGDEARRPLDLERDRLVELGARLVVPRHEAGDHESLRLAARLREPALHEQNVEPLLHRPGRLAGCERSASSSRAASSLIARPDDPESLIDEERFEEDEFLPYWAELWPSGRRARRLRGDARPRRPAGAELGCGLALPSFAAALGGRRCRSPRTGRPRPSRSSPRTPRPTGSDRDGARGLAGACAAGRSRLRRRPGRGRPLRGAKRRAAARPARGGHVRRGHGADRRSRAPPRGRVLRPRRRERLVDRACSPRTELPAGGIAILRRATSATRRPSGSPRGGRLGGADDEALDDRAQHRRVRRDRVERGVRALGRRPAPAGAPRRRRAAPHTRRRRARRRRSGTRARAPRRTRARASGRPAATPATRSPSPTDAANSRPVLSRCSSARSSSAPVMSRYCPPIIPSVASASSSAAPERRVAEHEPERLHQQRVAREKRDALAERLVRARTAAALVVVVERRQVVVDERERVDELERPGRRQRRLGLGAGRLGRREADHGSDPLAALEPVAHRCPLVAEVGRQLDPGDVLLRER